MQLPYCLAERVFHVGKHRTCKAFFDEHFVSLGLVADSATSGGGNDKVR